MMDVYRCYYQEKFFGCSQFDVPEVDDSKQGLIPYFNKDSIVIAPGYGMEIEDVFI